MNPGKVYLVPSLLDEEGLAAIPLYIIEAIKDCQVLFVENERTTRRYLKKLWKEIVIDDYEWFTIKDTPENSSQFKQKLEEGKNIAVISEAGCPGVADPGQAIVALAQEMNAVIKPLVGPSSILLALMASGMNGQQFRFAGYLPIDNQQRIKAIKELENRSAKEHCTQIFIETPSRNNQLFETICKNCKPGTLLCVAADLTSSREWIKTQPVAKWQNNTPDLHKRPVIFLLLAGN